MISGWLVFGVVMIYLLICVAFGMLRGLAKARLRAVTIALSAILAVVTTLIAKQTVLDDNVLKDVVLPIFFDNGELVELLNVSPALAATLQGTAIALVAPIVCFVCFLVYSILTWIIYMIVWIILRKGMKKHNEKSRLQLLRAAGAALLQGLVVVFVIMIPLVTYLNVAAMAAPELEKAEVLQEDDTGETVQVLLNDCARLHDSFGIKTFRVLGVDALSDAMTTFKYEGNKIHVMDEIGVMTSMVGNVAQLSKVEMEQYSAKEADVFRSIADSFDRSVLLPTVLGEFMYNATESWKQDEAFLEIEKPSLGEDELFTPFMDEMIFILNTDSKTITALQADVRTIADMIAIFAKNGIFASVSGETTQLMNALSADGVVNELVTTLGNNNSMKRLIPQITNLGIRAIGQTLGIPETVDVVYDDFLTDVTVALNEVRDAQGAERVELLTERLNTAFDEAGVDVDKDILAFYSTSMVHDLIDNNSNSEVNTVDVQAFFAMYATYAETEEAPVQSGNANGSIYHSEAIGKKDQKDAFKGSVYENMSEEDFEKTAAAKLAGLCTQLSKMEESETFSNVAQALVVNTFSDLLGEDNEEVLAHLKEATPQKPISADSVANTAGLQSSTEMKTEKITLDRLLVDVEKAAEQLTGESVQLEADAISAIISSAGELLDMDMDNIKLEDVATHMGSILDSLNVTDTFGSDKTAELMTAVFQSETVRKSADLDMMTATKMAQKATEGDVNYTQTLTAVSKSMDVLQTLNNDEELTDEELAEMIRTITPQSAGMLEVYATPERMESFGTPEKHSEKSSKMMVSMFSYMGREDLPDYDAEARALNQVLNVAMAAKSDDSKKVFSTKGQDDGRLPEVNETVSIMMSSNAVTFAAVDTLTDGEKVTDFDPFGLGEKMDSAEGEALEQALRDYYAQHPETDALTMQAMAALFGLDITF